MDLSVNLGSVGFEHPVMNAAGTCKTIEDVKRLAKSLSAAIVVGSATWEPRLGNQGNTYWFDPQGLYSLNSVGLQNPGAAYYQQQLPLMVSIAHEAGKPLIFSVAGLEVDEFIKLIKLAKKAKVDIVELNLSCPNVRDSQNHAQIAAYDSVFVTRLWSTIIAQELDRVNLSFKLPPFLDPEQLRTFIWYAMMRPPNPIFTVMNTVPSAYSLEADKKVITSGSGLAGMGGPAIKPIALGQIVQVRRIFTKSPIIGVGGINSGQDVVDFQSVGAVVVQVGTAYINQGERIFEKILTEYIQILEP